MKKFLSLLLAVLMVAALCCTPTFAATTANRTTQALIVNGESVTCDIFNIEGSNYFKLRDLACLLNGTDSQFAVGYDSATNCVTITTGAAYEVKGSELKVGTEKSMSTAPTKQSIYVDGKLVTDLSVYNIGGNNFFKLRDLGAAVGFNVDYDSATRAMIVESGSARSFLDFYELVGKNKSALSELFPEFTWGDEGYGAASYRTEYPFEDIWNVDIYCEDQNDPEKISQLGVYWKLYRLSAADSTEKFTAKANSLIEILDKTYGEHVIWQNDASWYCGTVEEFLADPDSGKNLGLSWGGAFGPVQLYCGLNGTNYAIWTVMRNIG